MGDKTKFIKKQGRLGVTKSAAQKHKTLKLYKEWIEEDLPLSTQNKHEKEHSPAIKTSAIYAGNPKDPPAQDQHL